MTNYKRWYDSDETLQIAVNMIEQEDKEIQMECAELIINKAKSYGVKITKDDLDETVKNFFRRWYDKNKRLQEAFEYLKRAPFDVQKGIAFSIIEKLQEKI